MLCRRLQPLEHALDGLPRADHTAFDPLEHVVALLPQAGHVATRLSRRL